MSLKIFHWSITIKLFLINLSAILVLGGILIIAFVSFNNIETLVTVIVKRDFPRVMDNSQTGEELTSVFAELLMEMFYGQEEMAKKTSDDFEQMITQLHTRNTNPRLQAAVEEFMQKLASLYDQFIAIRKFLATFKKMESDMLYSLETLQDIIDEQIEMLSPESEDAPFMRYMEQLKAMNTRYREIFLDITMQVAELRGGKIRLTGKEEYSVIADLDFFHLELQVLSAADSEIRNQGKQLMEMVLNYKDTVIRFLQATAEFQKQLQDVSDSKEHVMNVLKEANEQIANTAGNIQKRIDNRVHLSRKMIMFLSGAVFVVMLLITYSVYNMFKELQKNNEMLNQRVEERTAELARAKNAADAANRAKSVFLANMSHELRTPLNAILGFAQLMTRSQTLLADQRENLGIIQRSGELLLTLINQVLDLSKIEAGRTMLNETDIDLYHLLDDLVDMFRLRAEERHLQLVFERDPEVPRYIRTDEVKLRQVLINLLNNALKFTKEGDVAVRVKECQNEVLACQNSVLTLQFEIEDTGPGIAPDELDNLFEAFVQTTTGRKAQEGTGLGLPISRQFVRLMGGDIHVHSEVGHGTIFMFAIQCSVVDSIDNHQAIITNRVVALAPDQPRYRLLIVDDKWDNRQLLVKLLNPFGFDLREAENGQQAIDVWEAWEPHLIWMDMRMPVMDGYEATKRIKSSTKGQATTIIALTASAFEEERSVVLSAGCDDFLRKPFKEADIFEMLQTHLGIVFIYEEAAPEEENPQPSQANALTADTLAALPAELVKNLEQTILIADQEHIFPVLEQIRKQDAPLADMLREKVENFRYAKILALLQETLEQGPAVSR